MINLNLNMLKAVHVYTFGNCRRPVSSLRVSVHKYALTIWAQLVLEVCKKQLKKKHPVVCFHSDASERLLRFKCWGGKQTYKLTLKPHIFNILQYQHISSPVLFTKWVFMVIFMVFSSDLLKYPPFKDL